ncbi:hypothetical protein SUBVAR_05891 [Subdoligranulum variabile DSM 15176]|uniref:Uncharacterized protein n=1 Tax=Subdoligranulum variabile DSM 15176 TaxID=411471 RepID=D1PNH0_9FIRM|nr:hypothetical protein SUBVAR_05891 [Subdoligranulum variabile DSM 15176]
MGIKGDDILDAYRAQLLQGERAVQTLAADAAMLAAAVQAGHDDADAVGTAGNRLDQTHQILEVIVGREVILVPEQLVGNTVVARIDEDKQIVAAGRGLDQALGITGLKTRAIRRDDERLHIHADLTRPADQMTIHQFAEFFGTRAGDQAQISNCIFFGKKIARAKILFSHTCLLLTSIIKFIFVFKGHTTPFISIVAQRPDKISPVTQVFRQNQHFLHFKYDCSGAVARILSDFTKNLHSTCFPVFEGAG